MLQANGLQHDRHIRQEDQDIFRIKADEGGQKEDEPSSDQGYVARFPGPGEEGVDKAATVDVAMNVGDQDQNAEEGEGGLWEERKGKRGKICERSHEVIYM